MLHSLTLSNLSKSPLVACALSLGACVASPADPAPATLVVPRLTANALTASAVFHGALTTDVLDGTGAAAMAATGDARQVLAYAVGCALDASQAITFTVGGVEYTDPGALGLAPGWTTGGLSASEAAWVSACVFSRVNLTGTSIAISARGAAAGLAATTGELASYQLEEGAFWGNAFVDLGAIAPYSCNGVDQAADDSIGDLPYRQCAQWDGVAGSQHSPCGMSYAGLCSDACATTAPYTGCAFPGGTASSSVVTSFLFGTP
jgi:hypothetical protein